MDSHCHYITKTHRQKTYVTVYSNILVRSDGCVISGKTVKQFKADFPDREFNMDREAGNLRLAQATGCPTVILLARTHDSIITGYVAGDNLSNILAKRYLSDQELISLLIKVIASIRTLHRAGIVHGDTHPSNFLVTHDGTVLICDLGLSHSASFPFVAPPPTAADIKYFSPVQNRALEHDTTDDVPGRLLSNDLGPETDFHILTTRLLASRKFAPSVEELFRRIINGECCDADQILQELKWIA